MIKNIMELNKPVLPLAGGSIFDIVGIVEKVVKRDGQFKLVIKTDNAPGFVVFADCLKDAENFTKLHIRKGSHVSISGKFQTYGASAFCLSECCIEMLENVRSLMLEKTSI